MNLFDATGAEYDAPSFVTVGSALYLAYWRGFEDAHQARPRIVTGDADIDRYYADGRRLGALVAGFVPKTRRLPTDAGVAA